MKFGFVMNRRTGEKRMGSGAVLSGKESDSGEWEWECGEEWQQSPRHVLNLKEFARHLRNLDRAFAPE
jgi:hypothetical protein